MVYVVLLHEKVLVLCKNVNPMQLRDVLCAMAIYFRLISDYYLLLSRLMMYIFLLNNTN